METPLLTDEESERLRDIMRREGSKFSLPLYDLLGPIASRTPSNKALLAIINADLAAHGIAKTINDTRLWRARKWYRAPEADKAAHRAGLKQFEDVTDPHKAEPGRTKAQPRFGRPRSQPSAEDRLQRVKENQAQIRLAHAENLYRSMHNAPKGKLNLPLKQRVEEVQQRLDDIFEIPPETAVLGYGPELCRLFTPSRAEWWMKFCELNEARWKAEVPDLPPISGKRAIPLAERDLSMTERAILDWLRKQTTPDSDIESAISATEAAVAARCSLMAARTSLTKLYNNGLAEIVGIVDGHKMYVAT